MQFLYLCIFLSMTRLILGEGLSEELQPRYKLYCMYTPNFHTLYQEYFLPSLKDDFEVIVSALPEECPSGEYRSDGWDLVMLRKLELLEEAIQTHWGNQVFFYSDVDIIFLQPILEITLNHLGDHDFVAQNGWPLDKLCAGFFVIKGNERTLELIKRAQHLLKEKTCPDDQVAIRTALTTFTSKELSWALLPSEQFPNGKRVLKEPTLYSKEAAIALDSSAVLFHANCCIGLDNKYDFLNRVQAAYNDETIENR